MKKRSLWSRVLTILLVVCMLMTDQSTSLFVEAVSAAAQQQTEGEETLQQSSGENNQEIQGGGEETSQNTEIQEPTTEQEPETQEGSQTETDGNEEQTGGNEEPTDGNDEQSSGNETVTPPEQEEPAAEKNVSEQESAAESQPLTASMQEARKVKAAYSTIDELAEAYYGDENAPTYRREPSISIQRTDNLGESIKAGDVLNFHISYTFPGAPLYEFGNQAEAIFDSYDNSKIILKLPAGLRAIDDQTALLPNISGIEANEKTEGTENAGYWIYTNSTRTIRTFLQ